MGGWVGVRCQGLPHGCVSPDRPVSLCETQFPHCTIGPKIPASQLTALPSCLQKSVAHSRRTSQCFWSQ